jgi:hypothetical protein
MDSLVYHKMDHNYGNFIGILFISITATLLLSLHYYLKKLPIWLVIIGQYLTLLVLIGLCIWVVGHFVVLHPNAYRDMFVSFTIPYIIGASLYYISFWKEVKKANVILQDIKRREIGGKISDKE